MYNAAQTHCISEDSGLKVQGPLSLGAVIVVRVQCILRPPIQPEKSGLKIEGGRETQGYNVFIVER